MRRFQFVALVIVIASHCFADHPPTAAPMHILAPRYPAIAKTAHITGEVDVQVKINADGSVGETTAVSGPGLLYGASEDTVRQWRFARPSNAPLVGHVFCDYKLNPAVENATSDVVVTFDLPNRVTILATPELIHAQASRSR